MPTAWKPPRDDETRNRALGADEDTAALSRCWACAEPLPRPRPFDWLAKGQPGERDRGGQSVQQFLRPGPHRLYPSKRQNIIYLTPVGGMQGSPPTDRLLAVLEAFFGMPARLLPIALPSKAVDALERSADGAGYGTQFEAPSVNRMLQQHKPRDGIAIVGFTMDDLCDSAKGFGFLFGQANLDCGAATFSFARYSDDGPSAALFLRRCALVLCHEVAHLFGIKHCIWAKCVMNGSNHLAESEDRPFALCPIDLKKLVAIHKEARLGEPLCIIAREENICRWLDGNDLADDAAHSRQLLAAMRCQAVEKSLAPTAAAAAPASGKAHVSLASTLQVNPRGVEPTRVPSDSINSIASSLEDTWAMFARFDAAGVRLQETGMSMLARVI
mmetsp:Transcript_51006/g.117323  ORF Transcript_51006/g.117323 Transcript_51006/m.117323 type:complete len:386 (-) Transcript_51006:99-1256(-)